MTYTPPQWRVGYVVGPVLLLTLAAGLFLALQQGTLWVAALAGGAIAGLFISVAWALRHFVPNASAALVGAAIVPLALLWLVTPGAGFGGVGAAAGVFAIWFGIDTASSYEAVPAM